MEPKELVKDGTEQQRELPPYCLTYITNKLIAESIRREFENQLITLRKEGMSEYEIGLIKSTVLQTISEFEDQSGTNLMGINTRNNWVKIVQGKWKECLR